MDLITRPLAAADRAAWEPLARGYKRFYATDTSDAEYERAWQRLVAHDRVFGMAAELDGRVAGIAHYLFHTSTWTERVCYLQDLFVAPEARNQGVARALIAAVAGAAQASGATRYYWFTQEHNAVGRALYDKVARFNGFLRYDFDLGAMATS